MHVYLVTGVVFTVAIALLFSLDGTTLLDTEEKVFLAEVLAPAIERVGLDHPC